MKKFDFRSKGFIQHHLKELKKRIQQGLIINGAGFTLVEILVVIALIGILVGVLLVSLQGVRASARDVQRKADFETIQSALEMYKSTCGKYPDSGSMSGTSLTGTCGGTTMTFLSVIPKDPIATKSYSYSPTPATTRTSYSLSTMMESGQVMVVTPLTTTYFTPTATLIPTATATPTATPTICPLLPIGGNCLSGGDAACCSGYCRTNNRCGINPNP